jgi:hypothetical protein
MIARWELLKRLLQSDGGWNDPQHRLAFDLLGTPADLRPAHGKVVAEGDVAAAEALAEREIARLRGRLESGLNALDESQRARAIEGRSEDEDATTRRLRRYEASFRRAIDKAWDRLAQLRAEAAERERERKDTIYGVSRKALDAGVPAAHEALRERRAEMTAEMEQARKEGRPIRPVMASDWEPFIPPMAGSPLAAKPVVAAEPAVSSEPTTVVDPTLFSVMPPISLSPLPARTAAHQSAGPMTRRQRKALLAKAHKAARNQGR